MSLETVTYTLAIIVVVLFGVAASVYSLYREHKQGKPDSPEFFLTARHSVSTFTIAWSFYAAAMGSWALFGPPSYALVAGVLGITFYAIASGIPILVIAFFGRIIHKLMPDIKSMADFVKKRFGIVLSLYVSGLMLFNMGIALTAEYTAMGDLFQYVIGTTRVPIVIVVGVVAMVYTVLGGLFVSIITDQWQALISVLFLSIVFIYVCCTYDAPLGPLPDELGPSNYNGLSAIAVMPISLISATLFSEAMWQRCWAPVDDHTLMWGALWGCLAVIAAVFLLGFGGLLAAWGNVWVPSGPDDFGNTILFSLLHDNWIIVLAALLSVTMSESAVDSLQNAIVNTLSMALYNLFTFLASVFPQLKAAENSPSAHSPVVQLWAIRFLVVLLNIPPIVVSLQGYSILQLFLLANLITTTSVVPVMAGVIPGKLAQRIVTPFSAFFGCMLGFSCLFWWTAIKQDGQSYMDALHTTFLVAYDWPPFLLALGFSILGIFVGAGAEWVFRWLPAYREYPLYDLGAVEEQPALEDISVDDVKKGDGLYSGEEETDAVLDGKQ